MLVRLASLHCARKNWDKVDRARGGFISVTLAMVWTADEFISCREEPTLSTRNFDPETRTLRKRDKEENENEDTIEKNVAGLAEKILAEDEERRAQELVRFMLFYPKLDIPTERLQDLINIAPKRPNWDLKRELERKTAKLERKTQEAIHTLIRQWFIVSRVQSSLTIVMN